MVTALAGLVTLHKRQRLRTAGALLLLIFITVVAYLALLGLGPVRFSPSEVIDVLTGGGTSSQINVIWELRLPVSIATVIVGAALGIAGAWSQTMSRNPLASPDVLGVTGGASVAVVFGTVSSLPGFAQDIPTFWWRAGLAILGSLAIVLTLTLLGGVGTSQKIVLIGFSLSLMCQAIVSYLLLKAQILRAAEAQTWLAGSTGFIRMDAIIPLCTALVPFLIIGVWCARDLPVLAHDDVSATMLGVDIRFQRTLLLIATTGTAAVVVSVAGPIGFVALLAPHGARMLTGSALPSPCVAGAAGAALLSVCAVVAKLLPVAVPVGAITSVVGGIALVVLIGHHSSRASRH
ncbi:FecCD family ABC transporter permease [Corynebacterium cystitidis]|uniref:Iron complex transport system permease protein n=1 Tax=Corynebacterium cystitidis DSM 20524 TaxID=1121357 RepID=A0A1H9VV08_9CORY|nr:iron ABC transporter permease [Corynebacterium cystitidis]WJY81101.1 Ferric enterobactin transport system permease protein FepG [Corynebacterium cystitidis DSM 20524]SES25113.1 iron complex transport system permease protein [Corynebacterium cystitidis DSM 20524]SNV89981.1 iron complex ABC transporter permease [Corynebacterium cystitidis]